MNSFRIKLFITFLFFSIFNSLFSQQNIYEIADIKVDTKESFNPIAIINYSQLSLGQKVLIPGSHISTAINNLWSTGRFSDVTITSNKKENGKIWLTISVVGLPKVSQIKFVGEKRASVQDDFKEDYNINEGDYISKQYKSNIKNKIENYYSEKGFKNANVRFSVNPDSIPSLKKLYIDIDKGKRVKISEIRFNGNDVFSDKKLRKKMKKTKKTKFFSLRRSKLDEPLFKEDKEKIVKKYREAGYRDFQILSDSIYKTREDRIGVTMNISEGKKYYFGNISFVGNSVYSSEYLEQILGYKKGDAFNFEDLNLRVSGDPKSRDIHSLYLDSGYLFSRTNIDEVAVRHDSIDIEIYIFEGEQARVNKIIINGNTRTNDHVIYRELRIKPGDLFSRSLIQRSIREIAQLNFFDPEKIDVKTPVDPQAKTVDIVIGLEEKGSSQIELQGGYGGGRFIGTLGLSFNNFSIRNLIKGKGWSPLPSGDGQSLAIRAQAAQQFQSYSFSFTEPWLGGKKPNAFSFSIYQSIYRNDFFNNSAQNFTEGKLTISGLSIGLAKRLKWPDDFFILSQSLSFQRYNLDNYFLGTFNFANGFSNNINYNISFTRNSTGPNPIYPTEGASMGVSLKATPPYSLLGVDRYKELITDLENDPNNQTIENELNQERFRWLEFYKIKFNTDWYKGLTSKLVLRTGMEFGVLNAYSNDKGISPFERFYIGGTGLAGGAFDGREPVPLRGYQDATNTGGTNVDITPFGGGVIYNKFFTELRYPLSLNPGASIYFLTFLEGGNTYNDFSEFSPFNVRRSAGFGVRIFMPAFGLLGFDFGYGFDPNIGSTQASGWQTHFIIGQQF